MAKIQTVRQFNACMEIIKQRVAKYVELHPLVDNQSNDCQCYACEIARAFGAHYGYELRKDGIYLADTYICKHWKEFVDMFATVICDWSNPNGGLFYN